MTTPTDGRTDIAPTMPRWLTLVLASAATLIAIGTLWALAPSTVGCPEGDWYIGFTDDPGILPGPQPCGTDGDVPAMTTAGILLALLASVFVVSFTVVRNRGRVLLILGGAMLLVLVVGLLATVVTANAQPPVIYY